ncbi:iron-containing redox enzyme family protein [Streptomyces gilvosporeus]|uniref:IopB n=1 Tax=Streptomyces gilvosporeus TaxID=553510 RepID=A0A1V0TUE0_9ACTN|nr:iron-containing redox enzyme family protein [Streptomyces gilvosporeus]ARF56537.1 IopB [Streptomyces gilvosporeus]
MQDQTAVTPAAPEGLRSPGAAARTVYVRASDPEAVLGGSDIEDALRAALDGCSPGVGERVGHMGLEELRREAASWSAAQAARYREVFAEAEAVSEAVSETETSTEADADAHPDAHPDADDRRTALVRRAALGCAPLALISGAWLQWLSAPGNAEEPAVLRILGLYASDLGVGHPGISRGHAYAALLRTLRLSDYATPAARIGSDPAVDDAAFHFPGLLLAMSRRPDAFTPEILGADLCLRTVGLLPALAPLRDLFPDSADWSAIDPGAARRPGEPSGAELSCAAVAELAARHEDASGRMARGFRWALTELVHTTDRLYAELVAAADPAYDMAELIRLRAREGAVYHQDFELDGRPLSVWLKEAQTDPGPLLRVLAGSRLVTPGKADRSPLVTGLVGDDGPMFRVFGEGDLRVIRRWIASLGKGGEAAEPDTAPRAAEADSPPAALGTHTAPGPAPSSSIPASILRARPAEGPVPADIREAYHLLQGRVDTPALRRFAEAYVRSWLAGDRHGSARSEHPLPGRWKPQILRTWLAEEHDRHGAEFEENAGAPPPSREQLIEGTVQLAPLTLIDGSWIQGFTDYDRASSDIGFSLFTTYWDELGNGAPRLNHARIYRELLAEMEVEPPPTWSVEFAQWPRFADRSFELPVYWLCLGRFPRTFLPEVLGLNLAMELSGVGGSYRRARVVFKEHGFSTRFADIHNVIDNVATGHSAWAADAIDAYMATLSASQGDDAHETAWERVQTGYRSLDPPSGYLARRAARRIWRTTRAR